MKTLTLYKQHLTTLIGFFILCMIVIMIITGFTHTTKAQEVERVTVTAPTLNIRSDAGTQYPVLGKVHKGDSLSVLESTKDWDKIEWGDHQVGWVAHWLVADQSAPTHGTAVTSKVKGLNVHQQANINSSIIDHINPDQSYSLLGEANKLLKIQLNSATGWVASWLVQQEHTQSDSQTQPGQTENVQAKVSAPILNIREQPALSAKIVGKLKEGQTITINEQTNGWGKSAQGWVSMQYLTKQSQTQAQPKKAEHVTAKTQTSTAATHQTTKTKTQHAASKTKDKATAAAPLKNKIIVLDPGHGGKDNGTTSLNHVHEKQLTLETAKIVAKKLEKAGAHVILTRTSDTFIPLEERANLSRKEQADAFISLHYNYSSDHSAHGIVGFYYNPSRDQSLAADLQSQLIKSTGLVDRHVQYGDLSVLRNNSQPSTLIELGFLSNTKEELHVEQSAYREQVAQGIYQGLMQYFSN